MGYFIVVRISSTDFESQGHMTGNQLEKQLQFPSSCSCSSDTFQVTWPSQNPVTLCYLCMHIYTQWLGNVSDVWTNFFVFHDGVVLWNTIGQFYFIKQ